MATLLQNSITANIEASNPVQLVSEQEQLKSNMLTSFQSFRLNKQYTDCEITVENETFHLHKIILASVSKYLRSQLETSSKIELSSEYFKLKGFKAVVDYAYTGQFNVSNDNISDVFLTVTALQMNDSLITKLSQMYEQLTRQKTSNNPEVSDIYNFLLSYLQTSKSMSPQQQPVAKKVKSDTSEIMTAAGILQNLRKESKEDEKHCDSAVSPSTSPASSGNFSTTLASSINSSPKINPFGNLLGQNLFNTQKLNIMNQKQSPNLLQSYLDVLQAKQFNPLPLPSQTILPNSPVLGKKRPYTSHNSPPEATKMKEQQNDFFQSVSMKNLPVEDIDANNFTSVRRRTLNSDVPKPYEWKDFIKIKCPICQAKFTRYHNLKQHIKLHSGIKPFKCNSCGKSFTRNYTLKLHQQKVCPNERNIMGTSLSTFTNNSTGFITKQLSSPDLSKFLSKQNETLKNPNPVSLLGLSELFKNKTPISSPKSDSETSTAKVEVDDKEEPCE